jgi:hypothetical protein
VGSNPTLNIIIIFSKILNSFEYQISNQIDVAQFKRKRKVTKGVIVKFIVLKPGPTGRFGAELMKK